jgi:hypothetical protein
VTRRWRALERRFLVDRAAAAEILSWAREELDPDPHGRGPHADEYDVRTIYFDTPAFDVVRRMGSYGRAKYRIRRYNDESWAFLERKLRTHALLAKRRSTVSADGIPALLCTKTGAPAAQWFVRRLVARDLRPTCIIGYRRVARQLTVDGYTARVTVDANVLASPFNATDPFALPTSSVVGAKSIVELKFQDSPPVAFKQLVERFAMEESPVSKYRASARVLGFSTPEALINGTRR